MDNGNYEYWEYVAANIEKAGYFITALSVKTHASGEEFLLPFVIKSIDNLHRNRIVFTALYGEKVLYGSYLCGDDLPRGGQFSTNVYSFLLART